jgi:hypothetical protein
VPTADSKGAWGSLYAKGEALGGSLEGGPKETKALLSFRGSRADLFCDLSAMETCPLRCSPAPIEREPGLPPQISHENTAPSHQSLQKSLCPLSNRYLRYSPSGSSARGVELSHAPMCHRIRSELWKSFLRHDTRKYSLKVAKSSLRFQIRRRRINLPASHSQKTSPPFYTHRFS